MKITANDIAQLLASAPPRQLAPHVAKKARQQHAALFLLIFGAFFTVLGSTLALSFFPDHLAEVWRLDHGTNATVTGRITDERPTNSSINRVKVMEYHFTYAVGGATYTGFSYTTGSRWSIGNEVSVEYVPSAPGISRLEDGRLSEMGWGGLIVLVFPVVGISLIFVGISQRKNLDRTLREGLVTEADVVGVERTLMKVNKKPVYRILLSAPALSSVPVKVNRIVDSADLALANRQLALKQPLFVLYDPRKPSRVIFPEALIDG